MRESTVSILDGSTFLVSALNGDVDAAPDQPEGLFYKDMRHLSKWKLTLDGLPLNVLSTDTLEYFYVQHFCAPPPEAHFKDGEISVIRRRYIGDGFVEDLTVLNHGQDTLELALRMVVDADFADLFEVKDALKKHGALRREVRGRHLLLGYQREGFARATLIAATVPVSYIDSAGATYRISLPPKGRWNTKINVHTITGDEVHVPKFSTAAGVEMRRSLQAWLDDAPAVDSHVEVVRLYMQSLADIAALRFRPDTLDRHALPAAGLPWFMALFGRDSLITSYQMLPIDSGLAAATLRALAETQGTDVVPATEEEPGRIIHELRFGELAYFHERPQSPYYGASDTTPLFLILLDEYERWTGDADLVCELQPNARAALEWIDVYGDRDGDGYVEYQRKSELGLENQGWKDSGNSILYRDGTRAATPIATCEIQGYVYDARIRAARLAREFWKDEELAAKLERQASELRTRFNDDYWVAGREFYALALDGSKRQVDSLCSNIGHLLWSGIVDPERAQRIRDHLMGPKLNSGWGIRSMAEGEGGYSPVAYHNGTVWPHDCSIIAAGLARYGYRQEAAEIIGDLFWASIAFRYRLPEVFAGFARAKTRFPVQYATACIPQAWAAGTPMLGIRALLGLEPEGNKLTWAANPVLPFWFGHLSVKGIRGRWGRADVSAAGDESHAFDIRKIYHEVLARRARLGEDELAA